MTTSRQETVSDISKVSYHPPSQNIPFSTDQLQWLRLVGKSKQVIDGANTFSKKGMGFAFKSDGTPRLSGVLENTATIQRS